MTARFRGACDGDLALGMKGLLAPERIDDDRRFPLRVQQLNRLVDLRDVHEAPRTQIPSRESVAIRADRSVVVRAGVEIAPVRYRNLLVRHGLEVEDAERLA